jgi:hypothetical protein
MALQNFAFGEWPVSMDARAVSLVIDASGEKVAFIFPVPKSGDIRKVSFRLGLVTTGQTLKASLQDVDLTTGDPDGSIDQSGTVAVANNDDNTWKTVTFGADRTVTRGDLLACVLEFDSTVGNLAIEVNSLNPYANVYVDHFTAAWVKQARGPQLVIEYSDGSFAPILGASAGTQTSRDYNNGSTPDEIALRFSFPFPVRVMGAGFYGRLSGDCDLVLYDQTTALDSVSLDSNVNQPASDGKFVGVFATSFDAAAATAYRLAVKPTSGTNVRLHTMDFSAAGHQDQMPGGDDCFWSERTDAGAWSDTTTRRPMIFLVVEAADDAAGAGGGLLRHPGMTGGCPA